MKGNKKFNITFEKKIIVAIIGIILLAIIIYFFYQNINKNSNLGNNLNNKTNQEIEEYILNISSYETNIEVTIESNKNTTKYKMEQRYVSPNIEKQIIQEPSNITGLETIYDGSKLTIRNTKLNLSTVYENYPYITSNYLGLNSFIEDYKTAKVANENYKLYEENNQIIMEVILQTDNPYITQKKLFIDKTSKKIERLVVQDKNEKVIVYILYNKVKINSLKKEEVLAFRLKEILVEQY